MVIQKRSDSEFVILLFILFTMVTCVKKRLLYVLVRVHTVLSKTGRVEADQSTSFMFYHVKSLYKGMLLFRNQRPRII